MRPHASRVDDSPWRASHPATIETDTGVREWHRAAAAAMASAAGAEGTLASPPVWPERTVATMRVAVGTPAERAVVLLRPTEEGRKDGRDDEEDEVDEFGKAEAAEEAGEEERERVIEEDTEL